MEKAQLKLYDPNPGGGFSGSAGGSIPFQFNPKEVTIQKAAKWERKTAKGAKKAGPPGVQRVRALQAHAGDVLRRVWQAGRQRGRGSREAVQLHRPDRGERRPEEAEPAAGRTPLGADRQLPGVRHLGQREVHPLHVPSGLPIRALCSRRPRGDAQRAVAGRTRRREARTSGAHTCSSPGTPSRPWPTPSTATRRAWRAVARFNGIDDPLRCRPGTRLLLPSPEEL